MIDVSWMEVVGISCATFYFVGKKDLPKVANLFGTQVGRLVGFLQGARARADRFAGQSELHQLQNELRSGLRELDAVKSELAVSLSGRGMMGRTLGATTGNVNVPSKLVHPAQQQQQQQNLGISNSNMTSAAVSGFSAGAASSITNTALNYNANESTLPPMETPMDPTMQPAVSDDYTPTLGVTENYTSSMHQTAAAVAEQEWETQGIAFRSVAEQGGGVPSSNFQQDQSGSSILAGMMQQSLVFDRYDRAVAEQDATLQSKVEEIKNRVASKHKKSS